MTGSDYFGWLCHLPELKLMTKAKKTAADHSKDYRQREQEKAAKLGIEKVTIDMATGVKAGMTAAMKRNGIRNAQEAWQNLGLHLMRASPEDQDRMLRPDSSDFTISPTDAAV